MSRALANHTMMLCDVDNLARRRIEQHAYIPYTHGCRHVCDRFLTKRRLALGMKTYAWHLVANGADAVHLGPNSPTTFTQSVNHDPLRKRQSDG
jgi:hypothetical protein